MNDSFNQRRIGAAIVFLLSLATIANHYLNWGVYPRFSKEIMMCSFVLIFLYLSFVGPSMDEIVEYRKDSAAQIREPKGGVPWLYLLTLVVVSLTFVLVGPIQKFMRGEVVKMSDRIQLLILELMVILAGIWGWYQFKRLRDRKSGRD